MTVMYEQLCFSAGCDHMLIVGARGSEPTMNSGVRVSTTILCLFIYLFKHTTTSTRYAVAITVEVIMT